MTDRTDGVATYTGELLLLYSGRTDGKRKMLQSGCLSGRFSLLHRFSGASSVIRVAMVAAIYLDVGRLVWPVGVGLVWSLLEQCAGRGRLQWNSTRGEYESWRTSTLQRWYWSTKNCFVGRVRSAYWDDVFPGSMAGVVYELWMKIQYSTEMGWTSNGSVCRGRRGCGRMAEEGAGDDGYVKLNSTLSLLNMHGIWGSYIPRNKFAARGVSNRKGDFTSEVNKVEVANLNDHFKRKSLILSFLCTLFSHSSFPLAWSLFIASSCKWPPSRYNGGHCRLKPGCCGF